MLLLSLKLPELLFTVPLGVLDTLGDPKGLDIGEELLWAICKTGLVLTGFGASSCSFQFFALVARDRVSIHRSSSFFVSAEK